MSKKHVVREMDFGFKTDVQLVCAVTGASADKVTKPLAYLAEASEAELSQWFTPVQITRLKSAFELSKRRAVSLPVQIRAPSDAATYLMANYQDKMQEHFIVLCLNTKNRIISTVELYKGALNTSVVRTGEVFREAIKVNACAIIIAHNHPSGDITPSAEDVSTTRDIASAGKLLDIDLLDHLIIGHGQWTSLRERGLGF